METDGNAAADGQELPIGVCASEGHAADGTRSVSHSQKAPLRPVNLAWLTP